MSACEKGRHNTETDRQGTELERKAERCLDREADKWIGRQNRQRDRQKNNPKRNIQNKHTDGTRHSYSQNCVVKVNKFFYINITMQ